MNYYERHIGDYLKDTAHLSLLEHGIYTRLLDVYYTKETGLLASEVARLVGARSKEERASLETVLQEFFVLVDGAYRQARCDREIERYQAKQESARRSANARWKDKAQHTDGNANAMRTHSDGNAPNHQTPVTSNQSPEMPSEAKASGGKPPKTADEIIFGYGIPLLTSAGNEDKQARSFLGGLRKQHGDDAVVDALRECIRAKPLQPLEWLAAVLPPTGKPRKLRTKLDDARDVVAAFTGSNVIDVGGSYVAAIESH